MYEEKGRQNFKTHIHKNIHMCMYQNLSELEVINKTDKYTTNDD